MSKDRAKNKHQVRAKIVTESFNESDNTIDVVFVTENPVEMELDGEKFIEILSCNPDHVRPDRLLAGAPFLKVHDPSLLENQIGIVVESWFAGDEGWAKIKLSDRPDCEGIVGDIKKGILRNISVGYDVFDYEHLGYTDAGLAMLKAIDWEPAEISCTPIQADYRATTRSKQLKQIIKSKRQKMKTREEKIRSLAKRFGVDETVAEQLIADDVTVEDALQQIMDLVEDAPAADPEPEPEGSGGERADGDDPEAEDPDGEEGGSGQRSKSKTSAATERQRASKIISACRNANLPTELAHQLIEKGTSFERAAKIIVDKMAAQQKVTNARVSGRDDTVTRREGMAEAILHRANPSKVKLTEKSKEYRGYSLLDYAKDIMEAKGQNIRGLSKNELTTRALSTSDFPALLGNVTNRVLLDTYAEAPQTWKPLARQVSATDFRRITGIKIGGNITLEEIKEGGEYKQDVLLEGDEPLQVKTYGKKIVITRQAIINDDLNGFSKLAMEFANAAARKESDLMWNLILAGTNGIKMADGKTVFHADHGNLAASGAALDIDSLNLAAVAVMRQTGLDGKQALNLFPKYLVVSPENLVKAKQITALTDPTKSTDVNPYAGAFEPLWDARITGNKWFLAADPNMVDGMVYAYLSGHEGLYTEQKEGWDIDGVETKARLDFGAGMWDYRGWYKNPGQ